MVLVRLGLMIGPPRVSISVKLAQRIDQDEGVTTAPRLGEEREVIVPVVIVAKASPLRRRRMSLRRDPMAPDRDGVLQIAVKWSPVVVAAAAEEVTLFITVVPLPLATRLFDESRGV